MYLYICSLQKTLCRGPSIEEAGIFLEGSGQILAKWDGLKGQMKSKCIYEIIDFPKYHLKNLIDFCPGRFYRLGTCDLF